MKVTIEFVDPELDSEDKDAEVQRLLSHARILDSIKVSRAIDPNPTQESKNIGSFIVGKLTAEIDGDNAQRFFHFVRARLSKKPIEMEVESNGRRLKLKASSPEELAFAVQQALLFIDKN